MRCQCTISLLFAAVLFYGSHLLTCGDFLAAQDIGRAEASAMALDGQSNVYVAGVACPAAGREQDFNLLKYDPAGRLCWARSYDGPAHGADFVTALAVDDAGNAHVAGYSTGPGTDGDLVVVKYDAAGELLWVRRYDGPAGCADWASALALDGKGNVYVSGVSDGGDLSSYDYVTIKYTPDGELAWMRRYGGPAGDGDFPVAVAVVPGGDVCVAGYSAGRGTANDYAVVRYSGDGDAVWVQRYNGPGDDHDYAVAVCADSGGSVYVTGYSMGDGTGFDFATVKYAPDGDRSWVARFDGRAHGFDYATALALGPDGAVYVGGYSSDTASASDMVVIKYETNGSSSWIDRYDGPSHTGDACVALCAGKAGVCVGGYVDRFCWGRACMGGWFTVAHYDQAGRSLWRVSESRSGDSWDEPRALCVNTKGEVHVAGVAGLDNGLSPPEGTRCMTLKYDASGRLLWKRLFGYPDYGWRDTDR